MSQSITHHHVDQSQQMMSSMQRGRTGSGSSAADGGEVGVSSSNSTLRQTAKADGDDLRKPTFQEKPSTNWPLLCRTLVDHNVSQAILMILTIYALFGDNIRLMATDKPEDVIFMVLTIVCMFVFSIEIVLSCVGKDDYWLGFFFWLDSISTLSLILDIPQVSEALFGNASEDEDGANAARAGRAGRAGTRAGRIVRVIRLIRIVKLYKAMQEAQARRRKKKRMEEARKNGNNPDDDEWLFEEDEDEGRDKTTETRVGKKLSDLTTRRVIILVLAMLFVLPNLEAASLDEKPFSGFYGADRVMRSFMDYYSGDANNRSFYQLNYQDQLLLYLQYHNWHTSKPDDCDDCDGPFEYDAHIFWIGFAGKDRDKAVPKASITPSYAEKWMKENFKSDRNSFFRMDPPIPSHIRDDLARPWTQECENFGGSIGVAVSGEEISLDGDRCPAALRYNEWLACSASMGPDTDKFRLVAFLDKRPFVKKEAMLDTLKIWFICFVLGIGSMMFSKDANKLVLHPLEKMISKVKKIRDNPMFATKLSDLEFKQEEIQKRRRTVQMKQKAKGNPLDMLRYHWAQFNEKHGGSSGGGAQPMETVILEKTIIKIGTLLALGFGEAGAHIIGHNMKGADTAGVNAMIPGNRVTCVIGIIQILDFTILTEVLQGRVMTFVNQIAEIVHGIVDEFHGAGNRNNGDAFLLIWRKEEGPGDVLTEAQLAEMAVVAFVKVLAAVRRSPVLAEYRAHPGLLQRVRNYTVQLAYSLHYGWAIEGALGSEFKIDASYVSPNVNIAMRLVEAARPYGVKMLLSEAIVSLMSPELRMNLRLIDRVSIPGSQVPMDIFTIDLDYSTLGLEAPLQTEGLVWNLRLRFKARQALEAQKHSKIDRSMIIELESSADFKAMRARFNQRFFQVYNMAFHNYIAGEWKISHNMLNETRQILGVQDGPSCALLDFLQAHNIECPPGWAGYRPLPSPK